MLGLRGYKVGVVEGVEKLWGRRGGEYVEEGGEYVAEGGGNNGF